MSGTLEHLFSPVTINTLKLKNRAVMPPWVPGYGNRDGHGERTPRPVPGAARAGRSGVVITEVLRGRPARQGFPAEIGAWSDDHIPGLAALAGAVHGAGSAIALQLHHAAGRP